ncbi:MAG: tetratricopeptide repeat protein, partial [Endomicrobiales bacterium]|nr:tetratricopeptide repeat protein [Endomicrobiales bacterium]
AVRLGESSVHCYVSLGTLLKKDGRYEEAAPILIKAAERATENRWICNEMLDLGRLLRREGKYDEAVAILAKVIEIDPECVPAYDELYGVYITLEEYEKALKVCRKMAKNNPDDAYAYKMINNCCMHIESSARKDAGHLYKEAVKGTPEASREHIELGDSYMASLRMKEAERMYKKAIEVDPKSSKAHVCLGRLYFKNSRNEEAEAMHKKAIEIEPENSNTYIELGNLYLALLRKKEAERMYKKAIKVSPKNTRAYEALGGLYMSSSRAREAERVYRRAVKVNPDNSEAYVWLGEYFMKSGQEKEAERMFKKAIDVNPLDTVACIELCTFYKNSRMIKKVRQMYNKALEISPDDTGLIRNALGFYRRNMFVNECDLVLAKTKNKCPDEMWMHLELLHYYKRKGDSRNYERENNIIRKYYRGSSESEQNWFDAAVIANYREFVRKVRMKGVKMVCMQYPARSVKPLQEMLKEHEDVTFVSNEANFKEAIEKTCYWELFEDCFAGDFGHCTKEGNRLIAENLAEVIMREVVKQ